MIPERKGRRLRNENHEITTNVDWVNKNVPPGPEKEAQNAAKRKEVMQFINQHLDDYAFLMYLERVMKESRWGQGSAS